MNELETKLVGLLKLQSEQLDYLAAQQQQQSEQLTNQIQTLAAQSMSQSKQIEQLSERLSQEIKSREDFTRDLTSWAKNVGKSIKVLNS